MDIVLPLLLAVLLGTIVIPLSTADLAPAQKKWLRNVLIFAFVLRVAMSTIFAAFPFTRIFHDDAGGTEYWSMRIAQYWLGQGSRIAEWQIQDRNYGLTYFFGGWLYLTGRYPLNITIFNSLIGTMNALLVYRIGRRLMHEKIARRAALLLAFFPSMIIWSSIALKDPLMSFCICITLLSAISLRDKFSVAALLGSLLPMLVVYPIRFYLVYFMAVSVIGTVTLGRKHGLMSGLGKQLLLGAGLLALVAAVGFSKSAASDMQYFDLQQVSDYRHGMAISAHSSFAADADISTPGGALLFLPIGVATLIWGPFPWQMTSIRPLLTLPEMLLWWYLAPSLLRGFWFATRRHLGHFAPIIVFAVTMVIGYSLTMGNIGAAFRMRAQIFNFLFLFVALGQYLKLVRAHGIDEEELLNVGTRETAPMSRPLPVLRPAPSS